MLNLSVGERVGNDVENAGESGLSDLQYLVICLNDVMFLFRIHESSLFSEEPQTLEQSPRSCIYYSVILVELFSAQYLFRHFQYGDSSTAFKVFVLLFFSGEAEYR